jgi:hypothetical protein
MSSLLERWPVLAPLSETFRGVGSGQSVFLSDPIPAGISLPRRIDLDAIKLRSEAWDVFREHPNDFCMMICDPHVQSGLSLSRGHSGVRTCGKENVDNGRIPIGARTVQRRPTASILHVDRCSERNQTTRSIHIGPLRDNAMQHGSAVFVDSIEVGT